MGRRGRDRPALRKNGPVNVEYFRDVQPILERSCVACHTAKSGKKPAGNLVLDDDGDTGADVENVGKLPGTYYRLAMDERGRVRPQAGRLRQLGHPNASRYIRKFQSRRSLLIWKIFGERLDGFSNDDHPSEAKPGSGVLMSKGEEVDLKNMRQHYDLDYRPPMMPPPTPSRTARCSRSPTRTDAPSSAGSTSAVRSISTTTRRIPTRTGYGWMLDDKRPTVALTLPAPGAERGTVPNPAWHCTTMAADWT